MLMCISTAFANSLYSLTSGQGQVLLDGIAPPPLSELIIWTSFSLKLNLHGPLAIC